MSFRCQNCNKVAERPQIVPTKTRMHEHVELREAERGVMVPMVVGVGPQIVEEKKLCSKCA